MVNSFQSVYFKYKAGLEIAQRDRAGNVADVNVLNPRHCCCALAEERPERIVIGVTGRTHDTNGIAGVAANILLSEK
jgi:hypothetical protein